MLRSTITLIACIVLSGCATIDRNTNNPDRSRLGVLIIAGEGLNSQYNDPKAIKVSSVLFMTSQKFAESLHSEIVKRGTDAQLYINRNRNLDTQTYVGELLADKKRDGLIQVSITHIKNTTENTIYLSASYNPLQWGKNSKGESVLTKSGPTEKYKLIGDGLDGRNTPLNIFAKKFAEVLYKDGYIGGI